jgi:hypothetical protein
MSTLVYIIKYSPNPDGTLYNFFDTAHDNTLEDTLILNKLPVDFLQHAVKETSAREDLFKPVPSDYDIKLSFLDAAISSNGKSIYEFFTDCFNTKIYVNISHNGMVIEGFIANESIRRALTKTKNEFSVTFKILDPISEFADYYKSLPVRRMTDNLPFDEYINYHFGENSKLYINNELAMNEKVGFPPLASYLIQNNICDNTSDTAKLNRWKTFNELSNQLAFVYTMEGFQFNVNGEPVQFKLNMFWRSVGRGTCDVKIIEHNEGIMPPQTNKWVFIRSHEWMLDYNGVSNAITACDGMIFNQDEEIFNTRFELPNYTFLVGGIQYGSGPDPQPVKNTMLVHFTGQPGNTFTIEREISDHKDEYAIDLDNRYSVSSLPSILKPGVAMYCRIFVREVFEIVPQKADLGHTQILARTAGIEYKFLISGFSLKKLVKVTWSNDIVDLFKMITINNTTYYVLRISNICLKDNTTDIEIIEIN